MKSGKNIMELAQQLQDIVDNSRDFVVPTEKLAIEIEENKPVVTFSNGHEERFGLNSWSSKQLAQYSEIPQGYFDRIKAENPQLFAENVNHGLTRNAEAARAAHKTENRMIRTYRGNIRALVSDRYRRLDCFDLLETVAPLMIQNGLEVMSSELTERRMYIQATTPRIQSLVKVGDPVQYGLVISSSDVGSGSVRVEPLIYRLVCTNGMITSSAIRKFHLGRSQGEDDAYELLTDSTKDLTDKAFWAQVRDIVLASMKPQLFEKEVDKLRIAANEPITNFDIPKVVELASRHVGVSGERIQQSMVAYLANGADGAGMNKWGLANAFTFAAQSDDIDYDSAIDLERAGAKIIDLPTSAWRAINAQPSA